MRNKQIITEIKNLIDLSLVWFGRRWQRREIIKRPLYRRWDRRWRWKVRSLRLETVFVRNVTQLDDVAFRVRVLELTLGDLRFLFRLTGVFQEALLLRTDAIPCFVAETVIFVFEYSESLLEYWYFF